MMVLVVVGARISCMLIMDFSRVSLELIRYPWPLYVNVSPTVVWDKLRKTVEECPIIRILLGLELYEPAIFPGAMS